MVLPPINFAACVEANKDKLKPPVNNFVLQQGEFMVQVVGGPNRRRDYHVEDGEEWFYQYKGDMKVNIVENGEFKEITIKEGEMFLLPGRIPHNPVRFADTIGIVVERRRQPEEIDYLRWYCENEKCRQIVYQDGFHCTNLGTQLAPVIERYYADESLRTCKACGNVNTVPA